MTDTGTSGAPPAHYGNPLGEQRMLERGEAVVDLSDRGVIAVTGPDRLSWLDSLTSQSLTGLGPGDSAETLLLDPTGRVEHVMHVLDDGETTWLIVDAAETAPLAAWLDRMRFLLRVEVTVADDLAVVGVLADPLPAALAALASSPHGVPLVWEDPWRAVVPGGHQYAHAPEHPGAAWTYREVLVPRGADLGDRPRAGTLALEALRVAAWRPRWATEVDERSIPHELDWLRSAVHLNKGCYRGQETVAKVHNLGHPPRRLVLLHLDGSEGVLPPPGSEVVLPGAGDDADAVVGRITTSAIHHDLGPIALAVVKRSVDPAAPLIVRADTDVAAAQETIVPPDAGASANVPRLPRLGATPRAT